MNTEDLRKRWHNKWWGFPLVMGLAILLGLILFGPGRRNAGNQMAPVQAPPPQAHYTVVRGDDLHKIAAKHSNVGWEAILLANEQYLQVKYEETCEPLPVSYTNNRKRRGTFCNDRYNRPYGNTLRTGWQLVIPAGKSTVAVEETIRDYTRSGDRVSIVIDDSGSMTEDRRTVAQFYLAALKKHGRKIEGVYLYVDGNVRRLETPGDIESQLRTNGGRENTYGALQAAAGDRPDKIILITDEPGDDWPASDEDLRRLPPVIANCLSPDCSNLKKVAITTGGHYQGPS